MTYSLALPLSGEPIYVVPAGDIDLIGAFRRRCEGWAVDCAAGRLDLHDAVDRLQSIAGPLIDTIGQDAVQAIMAAAFRDVSRGEPSGRPETPVNDDYGLGQGWDSPMPDHPVPKTAATSNAKRDAFLAAYRRQWEANRKHSTADCSLHAMQAIVEASMRRQGTPRSTTDALLHVLRRRGFSCFEDCANVDRLRCCDRNAMREVSTALLSDSEQWNDDDIAKLLSLWKASRK